MLLLAMSAAFVGLVHSLAPGHWLPVVLMTRTMQWNLRSALVGALVAASGHIIVSIILGAVALQIGAHLFVEQEAKIEQYGGLIVACFGLLYAANSYFRHSRCHGHEHHGPVPDEKPGAKRRPYTFLFSLGLSPCVAVLPVFAAAAASGAVAVGFTMAAFGVGVVAAFSGATLLVSYGVMKLDHPIFEHYGDVITGLGVALMGLILFLMPETHGH